jgi:hypothetical protein
MKSSYIVNLYYGTWKNRLWFMGDDENFTAFERARKSLPDAACGCINSGDFFNRACIHFESFGFLRIQK